MQGEKVQETKEPEWFRTPPQESDSRYHHEVGVSTADSEEGALKDARKSAAVKVMNYWFKQKVSEDYSRIRKDAERHIMDAIATQGEGQVAGGRQVKNVVSRIRIYKGNNQVQYQYKAYVLMRYTMSLLSDAITKFKELKEAKTVLAIQCRSNPEGACGSFIESAAKKAAEKAGLHIVHTQSSTSLAPNGELCSGARSHNAIYLLRLELHGEIFRVQKEAGLQWAKTQGQASLVQTRMCGVIQQWSPETTSRPFKFGAPIKHSSPVETVQSSMLKALDGDSQDDGFVKTVSQWQLGN